MIDEAQVAVPEEAKPLAGILKSWSTYTAAGTFLLYLFGYLALRFHITALGINTDLGVLDEQYLFAGAHFLAYLASSLPWLALSAVILLALGRVVWHFLPKHARIVCRRPSWLLWSSVLLSVVCIQALLSRCFALSDLPFAGIPADLGFLKSILLSSHEALRTAFFVGLVAAAFLVCAPVIAASRRPLPTVELRVLFGAAAALAVATVLLVPVNFGTLILPYPADRATAIGKNPLAAGQQAWIIWRGKDWYTYLLRSPKGNSILDVSIKSVDSVEVLDAGSLFTALSAKIEPAASETSGTASLQPDPHSGVASKAAPQTLLEKLARVAGFDRSLRSLKGPSSVLPGELWISPAADPKPFRLGAATDFRSPVFEPRGKYVYALEGDRLVRVAQSDGSTTPLSRWPGIAKLVGFDLDRPTSILALLDAGNRTVDLVLLPIDSGKPEVIAARQSVDDPLVKSLLSWERRYGEVLVTPEGGDITVRGISPDAVNASRCDQDLCSQPSFAVESKEVVFIRSRRN